MDQKPAEQTLFHGATIRRLWHHAAWWYAVVDVIAVLTESPQPATYWRQLKLRMHGKEGAEETLAALIQLPVRAADNRLRQTDLANDITLLRIIQSIPSPRAEPFRVWLAQIGHERIEEIEHPERALERIRVSYRAKGYTDAWIEQRLRADMVRNDLTDEWRERGATEGREFAILTNEISQGTFDLTVQAHKAYKLLPARANLRDHMSPLELALISLGEATAITFHQTRDSQGFHALHQDAQDAGAAAGEARRMIETRTGQPAVTMQNHLPSPAKDEKRAAAKNQPQQQQLFDGDESGQ